MRTLLILSLCLCLLPLRALATPDPTLPERPAATPIRANKLILVGDSTTAVSSGWGSTFCANHVTSFLSCLNLARGGRSSYSYRAEGSWEIALQEMRSGHYQSIWVLLQFGHNDQPGKPGRSTDLTSEFPDNLRRYVHEIREAGAQPVLLTPLTRRQFVDGVLVDDLAPWAAAVRRVAHELDVPVVDLHARSRDVVQAAGPLPSMRWAQTPAAANQINAALNGTTVGAAPSAVETNTSTETDDGQPRLPQAKNTFDYTHIGPAGAALFSALVAAELAREVPTLRPMLIP